MIRLAVWLWTIVNRRRIPPLPRLFTSAYKTIDDDAARVMARYGIRSPSGIRAAMKKHKVDTIDDLVAQLEHHRVKRNLKKRLEWGLERLSGGTAYNPHSTAIRRLVGRRDAGFDELKERIKRLKQP